MHELFVDISVVVKGLLVLGSSISEHESVFLHSDDGLHQELVERVDFLAETGQVRVVKILVDLEALTELFKDLSGALLCHVLEGGSNLAGLLQSENLEFSGLNDKIELAALQNESVEEGATFFDETIFLVAQDLLLGDARDKAAGPSIIKHIVQNEELVIAAHCFPAALLRVLTSDGVSDDRADLLGVCHGKKMSRLVSSLKGLLASNTRLL